MAFIFKTADRKTRKTSLFNSIWIKDIYEIHETVSTLNLVHNKSVKRGGKNTQKAHLVKLRCTGNVMNAHIFLLDNFTGRQRQPRGLIRDEGLWPVNNKSEVQSDFRDLTKKLLFYISNYRRGPRERGGKHSAQPASLSLSHFRPLQTHWLQTERMDEASEPSLSLWCVRRMCHCINLLLRTGWGLKTAY